METLSTLMKEYQETKRIDTEDISMVSFKVRPGREAAKRTAEQRLESLASRYTELLRKAAFGIFVTGPGSIEFAKIANGEGESLTVDAEALYQRFAAAIEPTIGFTHQFGTQQLLVLLQQLREIGTELNLRDVDVPRGIESQIVPTTRALVTFLKKFVENTNPTLNVLYMEKQAFDSAVFNESTGVVVPVVVLNAQPEEVERLGRQFLSGRFVRVDTTIDQPSKELVIATFTTIQKTLKETRANHTVN